MRADDSASIDSNTRIISNSSSITNGGTGILDNLIEDLTPATYSSDAATPVNLKFGDTVQLSDDYTHAFDFEIDPDIGSGTDVETVQPGSRSRSPTTSSSRFPARGP
ncbi:MAG: hypothetical protein IPK28_10725 [Devosia sp.]|nr:hypothetical protein [Devosia sp.]